MDIQSSLPSPSQEEHLARLEAEEQANERLYKVLDIGQAMLQSGAPRCSAIHPITAHSPATDNRP